MAKGRILVVDDEIYIVHILDFSLGMEGYEVITALDGEQALDKARSEKPDLIVLDIMMPKLDGYETCKRLKADADTKDIPVILLSAKGRNVDQKVGYEVGADDYITKPFSPRKLVERINAILGHGTSRQRMQARAHARSGLRTRIRAHVERRGPCAMTPRRKVRVRCNWATSGHERPDAARPGATRRLRACNAAPRAPLSQALVSRLLRTEHALLEITRRSRHVLRARRPACHRPTALHLSRPAGGGGGRRARRPGGGAVPRPPRARRAGGANRRDAARERARRRARAGGAGALAPHAGAHPLGGRVLPRAARRGGGGRASRRPRGLRALTRTPACGRGPRAPDGHPGPHHAHARPARGRGRGRGSGCRGRVPAVPPARRHREREDRGLPARSAGGARGRWAGAGARARGRAGLAGRGAVPAPLRRPGRAPPQLPARGRAAPSLGAGTPRRARRGGWCALGGVRAAAVAQTDRRGRGARTRLQAERAAPLPRARRGRAPRADAGRPGGAGLRHAQSRDARQRRTRALSPARVAGARGPALAPGRTHRGPAPRRERAGAALGAAARGGLGAARAPGAGAAVAQPPRALAPRPVPRLRPHGRVPALRHLAHPAP